MVETTNIRKIGNSLGIILDKSVVQKVYGLQDGSLVDVDYSNGNITITPTEEQGAA